MGVLSKIEEHLGYLIEKPFAPQNELDLVAIEISMKRILEGSRRCLFCSIVVPNLLTVVVKDACYDANAPLLDMFSADLKKNIFEWQQEKGYETIDALEIRFVNDASAKLAFATTACFRTLDDAALDAKPDTVSLLLVSENSDRKVAVSQKRMIVGRGKACQMRIGDQAVSERHACLYFEKGKLYVEDLGSTNGTRVNREKIRKKILTDGDRIAFGNSIWICRQRIENVTRKSIDTTRRGENDGNEDA